MSVHDSIFLRVAYGFFPVLFKSMFTGRNHGRVSVFMWIFAFRNSIDFTCFVYELISLWPVWFGDGSNVSDSGNTSCFSCLDTSDLSEDDR